MPLPPEALTLSPEDVIADGEALGLPPERIASGVIKHHANIAAWGRENKPDTFMKGAVKLDQDTESALSKLRDRKQRDVFQTALPDPHDQENFIYQMQAGGYDPQNVEERFQPVAKQLQDVFSDSAFKVPGERIYGGSVKVGETPLARYSLRRGSPDGKVDVGLTFGADDQTALTRVDDATDDDVKAEIQRSEKDIQKAESDLSWMRRSFFHTQEDPFGTAVGPQVLRSRERTVAENKARIQGLQSGGVKYLLGERVRDELKKPEWADKIGSNAGWTEFAKGAAQASITTGAVIAGITGDEKQLARFAEAQSSLDTAYPGSTRRRLEGGLWNESVIGAQQATGQMAPFLAGGLAAKGIALADATGTEIAKQAAGRLGVAGAGMPVSAAGGSYIDTQREIQAAMEAGDFAKAERIQKGRHWNALLTGLAEGVVERLGSASALNVPGHGFKSLGKELLQEGIEEPFTGIVQRAVVDPITIDRHADVLGPVLQESLTGLLAAGPTVTTAAAVHGLTNRQSSGQTSNPAAAAIGGRTPLIKPSTPEEAAQIAALPARTNATQPAPINADPEVMREAARINAALDAAGVSAAPERKIRFSKPGKGTGKTDFTQIKSGDDFDSVAQIRPTDRPAQEKPPYIHVKNDNVKGALLSIRAMLEQQPVVKDTDGVNVLLANPDPRVTGASDGLDARARHLAGQKDKTTNERVFDQNKARWARAVPQTISDYDLKLQQGTEILYVRWYGNDRHTVIVETPSRQDAAPYVKDHGTIDWGLKTQRRLTSKLPNAKVVGVRKLAGTGASVAGQTSAVSSEGTPTPPSNLPTSAGAGNGTVTQAPSTSQSDSRETKASLPKGKPISKGVKAKSVEGAVTILNQGDKPIAGNPRIVANREALSPEEIESISDTDWDQMQTAEGYFDEQTGEVTLFTDNITVRAGETPLQAAARVIIHERIGHAGLDILREADAAFTARWKALADSIPADHPVMMQVREDYPHLAADREALAEEWFARMIEAQYATKVPPTDSLVGRMWHAIKQALRSLWNRGFSRPNSALDAEVREIAALSRQALADATGPRTARTAAVRKRFSLRRATPEEIQSRMAARVEFMETTRDQIAAGWSETRATRMEREMDGAPIAPSIYETRKNENMVNLAHDWISSWTEHYTESGGKRADLASSLLGTLRTGKDPYSTAPLPGDVQAAILHALGDYVQILGIDRRAYERALQENASRAGYNLQLFRQIWDPITQMASKAEAETATAIEDATGETVEKLNEGAQTAAKTEQNKEIDNATAEITQTIMAAAEIPPDSAVGEFIQGTGNNPVTLPMMIQSAMQPGRFNIEAFEAALDRAFPDLDSTLRRQIVDAVVKVLEKPNAKGLTRLQEARARAVKRFMEQYQPKGAKASKWKGYSAFMKQLVQAAELGILDEQAFLDAFAISHKLHGLTSAHLKTLQNIHARLTAINPTTGKPYLFGSVRETIERQFGQLLNTIAPASSWTQFVFSQYQSGVLSGASTMINQFSGLMRILLGTNALTDWRRYGGNPATRYLDDINNALKGFEMIKAGLSGESLGIMPPEGPGTRPTAQHLQLLKPGAQARVGGVTLPGWLTTMARWKELITWRFIRGAEAVSGVADWHRHYTNVLIEHYQQQGMNNRDAFVKARSDLINNPASQAAAEQQAKQEQAQALIGKGTGPLNKRIAEIRQHEIDSTLNHASTARAEYLTSYSQFKTQPVSLIGYSVSQLGRMITRPSKNPNPGLPMLAVKTLGRFTILFMNFMGHAIETGFSFVPGLHLMSRAWGDPQGQRAKMMMDIFGAADPAAARTEYNKMIDARAQAGLAYLVALGGLQMLAHALKGDDEDDEPFLNITGTAPGESPATKAVLESTGTWQEGVVRIGGVTLFSYTQLPEIGPLLSIIGNLNDKYRFDAALMKRAADVDAGESVGKHDKSLAEAWAAYASDITLAPIRRSTYRNLFNIATAAINQNGQFTEAAANFLTAPVGGSLKVPLIGDLDRLMREQDGARDAKGWGENLQRRIPFQIVGEKLYNAYGERLPGFGFFSMFPGNKVASPEVQAAARINAVTGTTRNAPDAPKFKMKSDGSQSYIPLSDDDIARYAELSGTIYRKAMIDNEARILEAYNSEGQPAAATIVSKLSRDANSTARARIWPSLAR